MSYYVPLIIKVYIIRDGSSFLGPVDLLTILLSMALVALAKINKNVEFKIMFEICKSAITQHYEFIMGLNVICASPIAISNKEVKFKITF